jgi:DNA-binding NarL/FixJ family response regulator
MTKTRVLLADDHGIFLEGLRRILDSHFDVVGTVTDGQALASAAQALDPEIIVTDITMPVVNGIEATRWIRSTNREVKIIFLSVHSEMVYVREALAAGGSAYVLKTCASTELVTAIQEVLLGRVYVTPSIMAPMSQGLTAGDKGPVDGTPVLTARQREVLRSIAEGYTTKETASVLKISTRTVEFHKYQMMQQLGVRSVAELTRFAIRHGILGP